MAWQIEFADSAKKQLKKLDRAEAKKITHYLRSRIQQLDDPGHCVNPCKAN